MHQSLKYLFFGFFRKKIADPYSREGSEFPIKVVLMGQRKCVLKILVDIPLLTCTSSVWDCLLHSQHSNVKSFHVANLISENGILL